MTTAKDVTNNAATGATTGSIFGPIGTGVGAVLGGISSFFGKSSKNSAKAAAQQYQYNLALQKQAQDWNEYMYRNRFQMQKEDMLKAEINPLHGFGQAPSVTSGTNSVGMADMVGEQNNKFNQMMSLVDFGQNLSARRAQTKLIEQQVQTEEQNTLLRTAEVLGKQLENEWLPKEKEAQIRNTLADTMDKLASVNERYASVRLKNAETARTNLENAPKERYEKWVRENPRLAKITEGIENNKDAIGGLIGAIAGGALGIGAYKSKFFKRRVGF